MMDNVTRIQEMDIAISHMTILSIFSEDYFYHKLWEIFPNEK